MRYIFSPYGTYHSEVFTSQGMHRAMDYISYTIMDLYLDVKAIIEQQGWGAGRERNFRINREKKKGKT